MKRKKRLKPYSKNGIEKYTEEDFDNGRKKKSQIRQEARDANRCLKKSKRQELKRELRNLVEDIKNEDNQEYK